MHGRKKPTQMKWVVGYAVLFVLVISPLAVRVAPFSDWTASFSSARGEQFTRTGSVSSNRAADTAVYSDASPKVVGESPSAQPLAAHTETHTTGVSPTTARLLQISEGTLDLVKELIRRSERSTMGSTDRDSSSSSGGSSIDTSNFVTKDLFYAQTDSTQDSISDSTSDLSDDLSESVETDLLMVSGNGTIDGSLTATNATFSGNLTVSGTQTLSGALSVPYVDATSTSATSTFSGGATFATGGGNVGIGTSSPTARLDIDTGDFRVFGDIITDAGSDTNTFFGVNAGSSTDAAGGGTGNTFIGNIAGQSNTTGNTNTAIGRRTFIDNTSGRHNVSVGSNSLLRNTTAIQNVAVGFNAVRDNVTGSDNVGVGYSALRENETGSANTAFGNRALVGTAGSGSAYSSSTALGYWAGANNEGDNNLYLGYQAGTVSGGGVNTIFEGSNNIFIGYDVQAPETTTSNYMTIGNLIFGTGIDGTGTTISSGNIGIGSSTPSYKLTVAGTASFTGLTNDGSGYYACVDTNTGELATSTSACGASSERFKTNIDELTYGLDTINQLRPVSFDWKEDYIENGSPQIGLIAEEVASTVPEVIGYDGEGRITNLDYPKLIAITINAIQELTQTVTEIKDKIAGFAERFVTKEVVTDRLCIADESGETTCLTKSEVDGLLERTDTQPGQSHDKTEDTEAPDTDEEESDTGTSIEQTATTTTEKESENATTTEEDGADTASTTKETVDTTLPEITLEGDAEIELTEGDPYTEPGYTATDDTDGDITSVVNVGGDTVDTTTPGSYTVTYNVTDAAGNSADEETRTVTVLEPEDPTDDNTEQESVETDESTETATSTTSD